MAVDATMRKLQVPPRFMPYLEKHRIYELFHDLGNHLAIAQPSDPLVFLKKCLRNFSNLRDRRVIILIAPPSLDRIKLAHLLSVKTGCGILSRYLVSRGNFFDAEELAKSTANTINDSEKEGWILADFPNTVNESKLLIKYGVIPTHAFFMAPKELENTALSCYDNRTEQLEEKESLKSATASPSVLMEFEKSIHRLKELFKSSLKVVKIGENKDLEDIASACARLTMKMPLRHAPKLFRVVLIGPRGSRRRTLAKILQKKFNIVHIDMNNLIDAGKVMENELGDKIRYFDKLNAEYPIKIVFELLKARMYRQDCINQGYVLTNFPTSLEDFVLLDSTDTPPNRVIFLNIEGSECHDRLEDRVVNQYTGKLYSKKTISSELLLKSQALTHPDDESCKVIEEIKFYNNRVQAMKAYCSKTGFVVDATGPISTLTERIEAVLMGPPPASNPRSGKLPPIVSFREQQSESSCQEPRNESGSLQNSLSQKSVSQITSFKRGLAMAKVSKMSYPISRMQVVPFIDLDDLMKRYKEMITGPHDQLGDHISSERHLNKMDYQNQGGEDS